MKELETRIVDIDVDDIEWLCDTEELIIPEENGGESTIEVYELNEYGRGVLIADNAVEGKSNVEDNRKILGYQIFQGANEMPGGLFSFMVFRTEEDAHTYIDFYHLQDCRIVTFYDGDIEGPIFIELRVFKKGERVFNQDGSPNGSDLQGWATMCADVLEIYNDQVVLLRLDSGSEIETESSCVYKLAEGKRCPKCGGLLCLEHDEDFGAPYYCPGCGKLIWEDDLK